MKILWIAAGLAFLAASAPMASSQSVCHTDVEIRADVEVAAGEFSLADLLSPNRCASLRQAAAKVGLGRSPLVGSVRVLTGAEVRAMLGKMPASSEASGSRLGEISVPERVSVRRAGPRAGCAAIEQRILDGLAPTALTSKLKTSEASQKVTCGAAGRVSENAPLEITDTVWDASRDSWQVRARCLHTGDCVPFLIRIAAQPLLDGSSGGGDQRYGAPSTLAATALRRGRASSSRMAEALVRPGQTVTLTWDQAGIRLVIQAVCLDLGGPGEAVRARILGGDGGGRLMRAVVEGAGRVRVVS